MTSNFSQTKSPLLSRAAGRAPLAALVAFTALAAVPVACSSQADDAGGPSEAGEENIVGGSLETGHPYVVALGDRSFSCTGTLIGKRTVVTAMHCKPDAIKTVEFGSRAGDPSNQRRRVVRVVKHPGFNASENGPGGFSMVNDIALLLLDSDAPVAPAPVLRETLSSEFVGQNYTFVGFGRTGGQGRDGGTKRKVDVPIEVVGPGTARDGRPVTETQVYYRTPGRSACQGDSGGPSFVVRNGVEFQAGVTSYGAPECGDWGVQQKVDQGVISSFLQRAIDELEGSDPCRSDGVCTESCNAGGQVLDPDCAAAHCGADGLCSTACVAPVDPDCSGTPTPTPTPPTADLVCPAGFAFEAASRLCVNATEAAGPFPPAMVAQCLQLGGADGCDKDRWAVQFARDLRGTGACPPGTAPDARKGGYCAEGDDLYGPFRKADVDVCLANGGGEACTAKVRWHRNLVADRP
jgi:hypothetical protein